METDKDLLGFSEQWLLEVLLATEINVLSKHNSVVEATSFCLVWCKSWVDVPQSLEAQYGIVNLALLAFSLEAVTVKDLQPWYKLGDMEKKTKNLWLSERLPGHGSSSVLVRPQWNCRWPASFTEVFVISRSQEALGALDPSLPSLPFGLFRCLLFGTWSIWRRKVGLR